MFAYWIVLNIFAALLAPAAARAQAAKEAQVVQLAQVTPVAKAAGKPGFNLNPSNKESRACTLEGGRPGICVKYTQCRDNRTIDIYGMIDDNEIRVGGCPGRYYWCCAHDSPLPPPPQCPISLADAPCEWCLTLHRSGGSPRTRAPDGRYCGGVLVADGGTLLTAASCVRAAPKQTTWVARNGQNYTVHNAATDPNYNSGSREHDIALIVLTATAGPPACLAAPESPTAPAAQPTRCQAIGYEKDGTLVTTEVTVTPGLCTGVGGLEGALCAKPVAEGPCRVSMGAPLLCSSGANSDWVVWGVSRGGGCGASGALYSSVARAQAWLQQLLPGPVSPVSTINE